MNDSFFDILSESEKTVDPVIEEVLGLNLTKRFRKLANYQIKVGGKRLRPSLLFVSCYLLGGTTETAIYSAVGVEILHNYTLILDDIIDNSSIRRGQPTVWKEFGISIAECVSIFYAASIFLAAQKSGNPKVISEMLARALKTITTGEIMDILCERGMKKNESYANSQRYPLVSRKRYFDMIGKKTAVLFETSCAIGGICANGEKKEIELLASYGWNIGMAFQIQDDILDIFGDEKKFGKKLGKDILERKGGNIVILFALEELGLRDKKELSEILTKKKIVKKDIQKAILLIKKTGAEEKSRKRGLGYIKKAQKALKELPQNKWNQTLNMFAEFVVKREI